MWTRSIMTGWFGRMFPGKDQIKAPEMDTPILHFGITRRSDRLVNYFLGGYFLLGLALAPFHDTWRVAFSAGGLSLAAYYFVRAVSPDNCRYQICIECRTRYFHGTVPLPAARDV